MLIQKHMDESNTCLNLDALLIMLYQATYSLNYFILWLTYEWLMALQYICLMQKNGSSEIHDNRNRQHNSNLKQKVSRGSKHQFVSVS